MSRSAWICLLLVCEVTRRFPGILGQCTNHTRPRMMKASPNTRKPIVGFQRSGSVCEWKIMADEGYLIQVTVPKPIVPAARNGSCNLTDLHFYDGESPHGTLLKGVCDFGGNLKMTSRGQVMLVQLPPAALVDKDSGQRWTKLTYTAYPCESPLVYFRPCRTPTLAGTTERTRDTTTTTSKQLTTTTTTNITTTTNNAGVNIPMIVSRSFVFSGFFLVAIFCCCNTPWNSLRCRCRCSMKPFTCTWSRWWRKKERERERRRERQRMRELERDRLFLRTLSATAFSRTLDMERQRRTRTLAAECAFVNKGVLSSDQDQTQTIRGSLSASTGDGQSCVETVESRTLSDSAFVNEGFLNSDGVERTPRTLFLRTPSATAFSRTLDMERERQRRTRTRTLAAESAFVNEGVLSSDQDQAHTLRDFLSASTGDGQSGVESVESRILSDSAFVNEGVLSSDQDQAHTLRDSLSASTEDGQSGVETVPVEPPRRLQQEVSPPPPPYSSLEVAEMDVHAQAQDEPPPPLYTEAMKTAYPPV